MGLLNFKCPNKVIEQNYFSSVFMVGSHLIGQDIDFWNIYSASFKDKPKLENDV